MTPRQSEMLRYLISALDRTGVSPSYSEIAEALGLRSKSRISILVDELEHRGLVEREGAAGNRRALTVTPAGYAALGGSLLRGVSDEALREEMLRRYSVVQSATVRP